MDNSMTLAILGGFIVAFLIISYLSKRNDRGTSAPSTEDFVIGGRNTGTLVLMLSMGATYFSTWTLLGSFGAYFREGVWFIGFAVWTIFHGIFVWVFGTRIWLAGKRFGFATPGQMIERYYSSKRLRIAVAVVGIVALVPVMLIQVVGGAKALESLTNGSIPYVVGVTVTSAMVGIIVLWTGFKGTAWTDSFMGIFFASILVFTALYVVSLAGGLEMFANIASVKPELLVNAGKPWKMLELWLGLGFGAWVLPHMWQKFYSAASPEVLGKVAMATPFWNSWMMAIIPLIVGTAAVIPGIVPTLNAGNSDTILPQLYSAHLSAMGAFVVAGILAAAISTINSQLLSSASLVTEDILVRLRNRPFTDQDIARTTRLAVATLTVIVFVLAMLPGGSGFLVPVASLGFGLGLQLVPSALGVLYLRKITETGAFYGLLAGTSTMAVLATLNLDIPIGPTLPGLAINIIVTLIISCCSRKVSEQSIEDFHGMFDAYLSDKGDAKQIPVLAQSPR